jgi:hypothetical protein
MSRQSQSMRSTSLATASLAFAILATLGAVPQQAPARDTTAPFTATTGTASISGIVVADQDPAQPVRRANVMLSGPDLRPSRGAVTDDEGRFTIEKLPAGRMTLTVARRAYLTSVYGAKKPGRPGTSIQLADGQAIRDLVVRLWRGAIVAGVLKDERGVPIAGVPVTAISTRTTPASPTLTLSNNGGMTNDLGEFRIFGLEPGAYVIAAKPRNGGTGQIGSPSDAQVDAMLESLRRRGTNPSPAPGASSGTSTSMPVFDYAPTYYPGTSFTDQAARVTLAAGQEQTALDFSLQRLPTCTVDGVVLRADGQPAAGAIMQLIPLTASTPLDDLPQPTTRAGRDGKFLFGAVAPGNYRIVARASGSPPRPPTPGMVSLEPAEVLLWASADVSASGADVSNVSMTLQPGVTIAGRVVLDPASGAAAPFDVGRVRITLRSTTMQDGSISVENGVPPGYFVQPAAVNADGSFTVKNVVPGSYRFFASAGNASPAAWRPRSAIAGGRDLLDGIFEVERSDVRDLVVTFSDKGTEIGGRLQTSAGAPVSDVFVIAFSADRTFWGAASRRVQAVRPGVDGTYAIRDLPPGDYLLGALTDVDPDEWQDPSFLEAIASSAIKISLAVGEKKTQNLAIR